MTPSTPRTINSLIFKPSAGTSPWAGLLIALFCALLLPGCGKSASSSALDAELAALDSSDAKARETAIMHLMDLPDGAEGESKVIGLLKDDSADVRSTAIKFLSKFENKDPEVVAAYKSLAASDPDAGVRDQAFGAFGTFGDQGEFIALCKEYLAGADEDKQFSGVSALSAMEGEAAAAAQTELIAALKSKNANVRYKSAVALGNLGAKATAEAKAGLEALASDPDEQVKESAKEALGKL